MSLQRTLALALIIAAVVATITAFLPINWTNLSTTQARLILLFPVAFVPAALLGALAALAPTASATAAPGPAARAAEPRKPSRQAQSQRPERAPRPPRPQQSEAAPATSGERVSGTVKWFNRNKGYGFITCGDGVEIFVHQRSLRDGEHASLREDEEVEFVIVEHQKGTQASDVTHRKTS